MSAFLVRCSHRLAEALRIEPGEGRLLGQLFVLAGLFGFARICFYAAANALFLDRFDASALPWVYIGVAGVTGLTGFLYSRLRDRVKAPSLFQVTVALLASSLAALRLGLALTDSAWLVMFLPVWFMVVWTFGQLIVWGAANNVFNVQQGKRLFGLVGVGEVLADSAAGLCIAPLVDRMGTENLLLVSAAMLALGGVVLAGLMTDREGTEREARPLGPRGYGRLLASRYLLLIIALSALMNIAYYFVDRSFLGAVQSRFASSEAAAAFLGRFYAGLGCVNLLGRAFLTGRVLSRYGLAAGLVSLPVTLACLMVFVTAVEASVPASLLLFWLIVACMFAWIVLRDGLDKPSTLLLYQPLSADERLRAQIMVETIFDPLATGLAGLALLLLARIPSLGTRGLAALTLVLAFAWLAVAESLRSEYAAVLSDALAKRRLAASDLTVQTPENRALFTRALQSSHPGEVLYSLNVLADMGEPLAPLLPPLLAHPVKEVRLEALRLAEVRALSVLLPQVRERLERETLPAVRAAALRALTRLSGPAAVAEVRVWAEGPDRELGKGALAGLLAHGGAEGLAAARPVLERMQASPEPRDRIGLAEVLGEVPTAGLEGALFALMGDRDLSVRRAALRTAGRSGNGALLPALVQALGERSTRHDAFAALLAAGPPALPEIERAFAREDLPRGARLALARALGRIPGAVPVLAAQFATPDASVRSEVLAGLLRAGYAVEAADQARADDALRAEVGGALWLLAALQDLAGPGAAEESTVPLRDALHQAFEQATARVFTLLCLRYPTPLLRNAQAQLQGGSASARSYAVEALEFTLSLAHRAAVLPLLVERDPEVVLTRLAGAQGVVRMDPDARLRAVLQRDPDWMTPWAKVCALYAVGRRPWPALTEAAAAFTAAEDAALRETARWALRRLQAARAGTAAGPEARREAQMLTIEKVLTLKGTTFFGGAPDEALAEVAAVLEEVEVKKDERIINRGELGTALYIVVDGQVRVHTDERDIVELGARSVVGELAALDPEPRLAHVTAVSDVLLLKLDYRTLDELIEREPNVSRTIIRHLCRAFREDRRQKFEELAAEGPPASA